MENLAFWQLWALSYLIHLVVYFGFGGLMVCINSRFPERKIQKKPTGVAPRIEIAQSLFSLIATSGCIAGAVWCQREGYTLVPIGFSWWALAVWFGAIVVLNDLWLYIEHRAFHHRLLIRWHKVHHRNSAPTVWSNDNFSIVEAFVIQSFFLFIPFLLPVPYQVLMANRVYDQVKGMIGHSGYSYFDNALARRPFPLVGTLHHDLHHSTYNFNFANQFTWWDRVFGTLTPDYDEQAKDLENNINLASR